MATYTHVFMVTPLWSALSCLLVALQVGTIAAPNQDLTLKLHDTPRVL